MQTSAGSLSDSISELRRGIIAAALMVAVLAVVLALINFAISNSQRLVAELQQTIHQELQILVTLQRNISFLLRTVDSPEIPEKATVLALQETQQKSAELNQILASKRQQINRLEKNIPLSWLWPVETEKFSSPGFELFLSRWIGLNLSSDDPDVLVKNISAINPLETAFLHKGFSNDEFSVIDNALEQYHLSASKLQIQSYMVSTLVLLFAVFISVSMSIAPALRRLKAAEQQANQRLALSNRFSEIIAFLGVKADGERQSWQSHVNEAQNLLAEKLPACRVKIEHSPALHTGGNQQQGADNPLLIQQVIASVGGSKLYLVLEHPPQLAPFHDDLALFVERLAAALENQHSVHVKLSLERERDVYFSYADTAVRHMPVALGIFTSAGRLILSNQLLWDFLGIDTPDKPDAANLSKSQLKYLFSSAFPNNTTEFEDFFAVQGAKFLDTTVNQQTIRWTWVTVELMGWILFGQDISSDLAVQSEKQHLSQLEALGRVSGGVAHDMNNFLAVVLNNIELASLEMKNGRAARFLQNALAACHGAAKTNEQLLSYARKQSLSAEAVSTRDIVSAVEEFVAQAGRLEDLNWQVETEDKIWADKQHLLSAMFNVIKNALEVTEHGQHITIRFSDDKPDNSADSAQPTERLLETIYIQVEDQGGGFSEQALRHGLEPFYTTKSTGTGLGLAAVLGFVEQSGGSLKIDNREQGAVVKMILPKAPGTEKIPHYKQFGAEHKPLLKHGSLVLLIDDNQHLLEVTRLLLHHMGFKVATALSMQAGLERLSEHKFDLIVTDMGLEDGSGLDVAKAAKKKNPLVPVVYISGYISEHQHQFSSNDHGVFLKKPFTMDALQTAISEAVALINEARVPESDVQH